MPVLLTLKFCKSRACFRRSGFTQPPEKFRLRAFIVSTYRLSAAHFLTVGGFSLCVGRLLFLYPHPTRRRFCGSLRSWCAAPPSLSTPQFWGGVQIHSATFTAAAGVGVSAPLSHSVACGVRGLSVGASFVVSQAPACMVAATPSPVPSVCSVVSEELRPEGILSFRGVFILVCFFLCQGSSRAHSALDTEKRPAGALPETHCTKPLFLVVFVHFVIVVLLFYENLHNFVFFCLFFVFSVFFGF